MKTNRRVPASGAATPRKRAQRILKHPCPQSEVLRRGGLLRTMAQPLDARNKQKPDRHSAPEAGGVVGGTALEEERLDTPPFGRLPEHLAHFGGRAHAPAGGKPDKLQIVME